jgi:hypothetical protein
MFNPLDLFSSVKSAAITVGVIAVLSFTGTLWVQKHLADEKVVTLQVDKANLEQNLFQSQTQTKGMQIVIDQLQATTATLAENLKQESQIDKEINDAPATDDAPTAPVLSRALRSVDGMLHHTN